MIQEGGYLGTWSLLRDREEFQLYQEAIQFVSARMPWHESIVNTSILSAVNGRFGNAHTTRRTEGSELFIHPLMALHWAFRLDAVVHRNLYLASIGETTSFQELTLAIAAFRAALPGARTHRSIPC